MFGSKLKVAAGEFAGTMLAGGLAFAAIPGTDGTITACYTKQAGLFSPQGSLRVVNSPSECRASEVALNWNQQGQPGPAGPAGQDGEDGLDGLPGAPGQDGLDGQDGQPGPVGPAGRDGIDGQDGADGQDGLPGPVGPVGPAGPPGISAAKVVWSERTYVYGEFKDVATMTLPKGSYVIQANVTWDIPGSDNPWTTGWHPWVHCELREGTNVIGFGGDRRASLSRQGPVTATIPIHGGAIISGDTGTASVECKGSETEHVRVQMVAMQIGGFL